MDREPPVVLVVRLLAQQVEKLGVDHADEEIEGAVRVAHDEEQGGLPVPRVSSSSSSYRVISRSSAMSKGASRAPQEMRMDFAVLPAASL